MKANQRQPILQCWETLESKLAASHINSAIPNQWIDPKNRRQKELRNYRKLQALCLYVLSMLWLTSHNRQWNSILKLYSSLNEAFQKVRTTLQSMQYMKYFYVEKRTSRFCKDCMMTPLSGNNPSIFAAKIREDENGMREISRCLKPLSPRLRRGLNPVSPIANVLIPARKQLDKSSHHLITFS